MNSVGFVNNNYFKYPVEEKESEPLDDVDFLTDADILGDDSIEESLDEAMKYLNSEQYNKARIIYNAVLEEVPEDRAFEGLGYAHLGLARDLFKTDTDAASNEINTARACIAKMKHPDAISFHIEEGNTLLEHGFVAEALPVLQYSAEIARQVDDRKKHSTLYKVTIVFEKYVQIKPDLSSRVVHLRTLVNSNFQGTQLEALRHLMIGFISQIRAIFFDGKEDPENFEKGEHAFAAALAGAGSSDLLGFEALWNRALLIDTKSPYFAAKSLIENRHYPFINPAFKAKLNYFIGRAIISSSNRDFLQNLPAALSYFRTAAQIPHTDTQLHNTVQEALDMFSGRDLEITTPTTPSPSHEYEPLSDEELSVSLEKFKQLKVDTNLD